MPKNVILDQVTLCGDGSIGIRWLKQITDPDTGELLFSEPHRGVIEFDASPAAEIDNIASHLASMGYPVTEIAKGKMKAIVANIDKIGKDDPDISARRDAKIATKAALAKSAQENSDSALRASPQEG